MALPNVQLVKTATAQYLTFETDFGVAADLRANGSYDPALVKLAITFLAGKPDAVLLDIGANIGTFAVPVAQATNCRVHAFEAQRIISQLLSANLVMNRIDNAYVENVMLVAPGGAPERFLKAVDYTQAGNFGAYSTDAKLFDARLGKKMQDSGKQERVKAVTLDSYGFENVALIKLDVEGAELDVLKGALKTLEKNNYPPILFEAWSQDWFAAQKKELLAFIEKLGYRVAPMSEAKDNDNFVATHPKSGTAQMGQTAAPAAADLAETFKQAVAALNAGNLPQAEQLLRSLWALKPKNPEILFQLAQTLAKRQNYAEAQRFAAELLTVAPSTNAKALLAQIYVSSGNLAQAVPLLRDLARERNDAATWSYLANVLVQLGENLEAGKAFREAFILEPKQTGSALQYYVRCREHDIDEVIETFRKVQKRNDIGADTHYHIHRVIIMAVEMRARRARGLDEYCASDFDDMLFKYAQAEVAEWKAACNKLFKAMPTNSFAAEVCLTASLADGKLEDYTAIEKVIDPKQVLASAITAPQFYRTIDTRPFAETLARFPKSQLLAQTHDNIPRAIFVGCDKVYFDRYMYAFLGSALAVRSQVGFHVHVFDGDEAELRRVFDAVTAKGTLPLRITVESSGASEDTRLSYYHAVRFLRLMQYHELYPDGVWHLDADFMLGRDPSFLFDLLKTHDTAFAMQPGRIEPHNRIAAGVMGLSGSSFAKRFLKMVSGYLADCWQMGRLQWGADQMAIYLVMLYLRQAGEAPKIFPVTTAHTGNFKPETVFWPSKVGAGDPDAGTMEKARQQAFQALGLQGQA
ncbi:MAG: FkbM family methyltransferase [Rhodospirillaceae bacterium]|nr:FkbM family methyltransferase [Rhodospirillaceae bacterium]